jgi:hypothetical protein
VSIKIQKRELAVEFFHAFCFLVKPIYKKNIKHISWQFSKDYYLIVSNYDFGGGRNRDMTGKDNDRYFPDSFWQ